MRFDLSHFQTQGYQVLPDLIPAETVSTVGNFLSEAYAQLMDFLKAELRIESPEDLLAFMVKSEQEPSLFADLSADLRQILVGHFQLKTRLDPMLWEIPRSPRVKALLAQLYPEEPVHMHMPPTARFVLPGNRWAGVPAHQDISYNRHMRDFVTLWTPFVPIDSLCGGVIFYKGTGHLPEQPQAEPEKLFWQGAVSDTGWVKEQPVLKPGDGLILNPWVIHESAPNLSQTLRISIDSRYFVGPLEKHALNLDTWEVEGGK